MVSSIEKTTPSSKENPAFQNAGATPASSTSVWKNVNIKVRETDLPILNQRLKLYGYESTKEFLDAFRTGQFPESYFKPTTDPVMTTNVQADGQTSLVDGKPNPKFFEHVDYDKMFKFYKNDLQLSDKYATNCVGYFRNYWKEFFGNNPQELLKYTPHKRSWINLSMRNFGRYYLRATGSDEVEEFIRKTIRRYALNAGLDHDHKIYVVDENFVEEKVTAVFHIQGEMGFYAQVGVLAGFREDELIYIHDRTICKNGMCSCKNLHITEKKNGISIIHTNWFRGHKKAYFTIMPSETFKRFRGMPFTYQTQIKATHDYLKSMVGIKFMDLRKLHYNVMIRTMEKDACEALQGRARDVTAKSYAMYQLDRMAESYIEAWSKFGIEVSG